MFASDKFLDPDMPDIALPDCLSCSYSMRCGDACWEFTGAIFFTRNAEKQAQHSNVERAGQIEPALTSVIHGVQ
jgi:hypothetical protein